MLYPVLRDMNNWLDNDFDDMLNTLPDDVEKDKIEAKVTDGVLHITLPRTAKAEKETKKIEVA